MQTVNILGAEYTIEYKNKEDDKALKDADGYCDKTSRLIVVTNKYDECDLDNFELHQKHCLRHEIVHAFLFESGLQYNFQHITWGHEETTVDWIAAQFPKILKAFQETNCL